jgi:antitoxin component YwqK of YwqJK toxin-antitoxin module
VYDGVEELETFLNKGKIIYAFPFVQNATSGKVDYYDEQGKTLKISF